jgi:hypothetical protein
MKSWHWGGMAILLGGAMSMAVPAAPASASALGTWGGDRLQLTVDAQGARLSTDCASGSITTPLVLDAHGAFTASGTFEQHQPGPQRADDDGPPPARFSGDIHGDLMTLTIKTGDTAAPQVFKLRKGVHVKLVRCL